MTNKISSITPKKIFPIITAGLMTLTGCATAHQYYFNEVFYPDKDGYCPSK